MNVLWLNVESLRKIMAYHLDKYGDQVKEDLDAVEEKTIYPDASPANKGLMTDEHVRKLGELETEIDENSEVLSEFEIRMICK